MGIEVRNINDYCLHGVSTIVTVGMFDGLHVGHRSIVASLNAKASELGLNPIVVTFDKHPRQVLGASDFRLLTTLDERLDLLDSCGAESVALIQFTPQVAQLSACQFVEQYLLTHLNMGALVLGYDNMFGNKAHNDFDHISDMAESSHFKIFHESPVFYQDQYAVSSTKVRHAIAEGDMERANAMLGYRYKIQGIVVHGREVGRTIGFPTANVDMSDSEKMLPQEGVYAAEARIADGTSYMAMVNIGPQPTFGLTRPTVEVHLLDFDGDLYDSVLRVDFLCRLRNVCRFDSKEQLIEQLVADREAVRTAFKKTTCL